MRFAYIDSQGNEVSIPSVDALALRIELGAIGPDTQLYDAQADRWGPADSHEIFHTLSRDVAGEGGFVAPPPPVASPPSLVEEPEATPPEPEPEPAPPAEVEAEPSSFDFTGGLSLLDDDGEEDEEEAPPPPPPPPADDLGLDLTFADPAPSEPAAAPEAPSGGDAMSFDFAPLSDESAAAPSPKKEKKKEEEAPATFDFGSGLDLAPEPFEPEAPAGGGAMGFGGGLGGGMELEQPMSEFTPDAPPSWMQEEDAPAAGDGSMAFGRGAADTSEATPPRRRAAEPAGEEEGGEERPRREPRSRPSPPKRVRKKSPAGLIMGVVGVAVVGAGGWFGWQFLQGRGATTAQEEVTPALPPVVIPDIPAEFLPQMRDLGEAALSGMMAQLRDMQTEFDLPVEPNPQWLAGAYLANASQFGDVQAFWEGLEAYVSRVREMDTQVFHDQYVAQLEAAGLAGDTAAMLLERADSGFLATRGDRFEAYRLMDDLIVAALDLHAFLVRNEANIEYDPAAGGVSRDPVLEAVPNSRELGNEMWGMVDRITSALDALGTLDRVTTERLTAVLYDRIRRAGFQ